MLKTFLKCIREFKLPTVLTLLMIVGEVFIEVLIPFRTAALVNGIQTGMPMRELLKLGLILVGMALVSLCFGGGAAMMGSKASAGFARNVRGDVFRRIQSFSFENIDRFSTASLVTRLTTDVGYVRMAFMMTIRAAVRSPLMFLFSIIMAWRMGGSLAVTFVVVVPVLIGGLLLIARKAMPAFRAVFRKYDRLNESVEENVRGMRVVKGFAREDYEKEKFAKASKDIAKDFTRAERIVALNNPLMTLCVNFNLVFILWVGARLIVTGRGEIINVGEISAMITYGMQILMSLMMLSMIYVMMTMSWESMKRIREVLEEEPSLKNPAEPVTEVADGSIDFEGVSFKYSREAHADALSGVDLHIPSGATVGVLGGTGSGKSTLVQLIPRLYDATEGVVRVGGRDVRDYDIETLRNAVSMVLQKNLLFSGTVAENLRWGDPDATDEELREACRLAQADEFVMAHAEGYGRRIEQGGTNVSGGQKQRLCIARALLKHPKILILDDSTSAVDTRTDAMIQRAFNEEIPNTTKLIIAQRVASVQNADRIIVMDNGFINGFGTHEELLASNEIYREVYESQLKGMGDYDE